MDLKKIVVIGAGTMGSGIAQWFTQQHLDVWLVDQSQEAANKALQQIFKSWDQLADKKKFTTYEIEKFKNHLKICKLEEVPTDTSLAIEAVFEDVKVKKEIFSILDDNTHISTIFASNTSSLSINDMAKMLQPERQKRFLGLHFFNPAPIMKLVEIVSCQQTNHELLKKIYDWFEDKGKKPAACIDSPGFIVNRVARNFYGEPLRIIEEYLPEKCLEVDKILREVGGFKMGPFELMDLIGIDINYQVTCSVWQAYQNCPRLAPHPIQKELVDKNWLGRKTKQGFYKYE